jgi:hypothetical protein
MKALTALLFILALASAPIAQAGTGGGEGGNNNDRGRLG